jgi:HEXXH motif-containing protein
MRFLDARLVRSNMQLATAYLLGHVPLDQELHSEFIKAMNVAQRTTIQTKRDGPRVEFENAELVSYLTEKRVFAEQEIQNGRHLLTEQERAVVEANIESAMRLIADVSPSLYRIVANLIGTIAVYRIPDRDGGTVSCCIGLIWLSPADDWTIEYYAEMIVHEFVHNSVFLDDMVNGIMPNPELVTRPEAHAISALRKTKRPYDKAFHSACVATALIYFYHCLGKDDKAGSYIADMRPTTSELQEVERSCSLQGMELLNDNGRRIVESLVSFAKMQDYDLIHKALVA